MKITEHSIIAVCGAHAIEVPGYAEGPVAVRPGEGGNIISLFYHVYDSTLNGEVDSHLEEIFVAETGCVLPNFVTDFYKYVGRITDSNNEDLHVFVKVSN